MTASPFEALTRTGPSTPMGALLRKYWQPLAVGADLPAGKAKPVRIMSEDLTLYRGQSGRPYVVGGRCAHRGTLLHTGWVEQESIRCRYHGWVFDGTGQCVEMPAEDPSYPPKVKIASYPTLEYKGLIFAYLGVGKPPPFPTRPELDRGTIHFAVGDPWPCNWFQGLENSMDSVHVAFVHSTSMFGQRLTTKVPTIEAEETEFGMRMTAARSPENVRINELHFPNQLHIRAVDMLDPNNAFWDTYVYYIPIDDEHHVQLCSFAAPLEGKGLEMWQRYLEKAAKLPKYRLMEHHEDVFSGRMPPTDNGWFDFINAEDYIAQVGQGTLVDRNEEHLGKSDLAMILMRRIWQRELTEMQQGKPMKAWVTPKEPVDLPVPPPPKAVAGATG